MARQLANLISAVRLKSTVAALTSDGVTNETAVTSALLRRLKGGAVAILDVHGDPADSDADETYEVRVEGRDSGGVFATLTTFTIPRGAAGNAMQIGNVDIVQDEMRASLTLGGTTASIIYTLSLIAKDMYQPAAQVI